MATGKSAARIEAERLVTEFKDTPSRTLARRIAKEFKCSIEQARNHVRIARGVIGTARRKDSPPIVQWAPREAGWKPAALPKSKAEPWKDFDLGAGIRVAILSDLHVPFHDQTALPEAVAFCKKEKPDVLLINGDFGDWFSISRFTKNPKYRDFKAELQAQRDCLSWLRGEFRKSRIVFKKGNHDERWDHYIWNFAAELADDPLLSLDAWLNCKELGVEVVGDQRPILAGMLPIFHGHELPKGLTSPVNPARGAFLRTNDSVLVGHSHRASSHSDPNWRHRSKVCWSTGCLCELSPEYARINKWDHGFAVVKVAEDSTYEVQNWKRDIDDGKIRPV